MLKKLFLFFLLSLPLLTACSKDDILGALEHPEAHCFITNQTKQGVTISYTCYNYSYSYYIKAGEVFETENDLVWDFSAHAHEIDPVLFRFDDGTSYTHSCYRTDRGDLIFTPAQNNILNANIVTSDSTTWKSSSMGGRKTRYDYVVK